MNSDDELALALKKNKGIYTVFLCVFFFLHVPVIVPRCACASKVYGCVCVCVVRLLQLLKDQ